MRTKITIAVAIAALAIPAMAHGHITLQPDEVPAGAFERLDVRVPNERDDAGTVKVEVQFPDGFIFASAEPVPGWDAEIRRERLDEPVQAFGEEYTEQVSTVTFSTSGPGIGPGEFQDFGLSLGLPDAPGEALEFKALQTYDDGEVVRWIGPEDAEEPAPIVTLSDAEGEDPAAHGAEAEAAEDDDDGESESDSLALFALVLGGLGVVLGGYAASRTRR